MSKENSPRSIPSEGSLSLQVFSLQKPKLLSPKLKNISFCDSKSFDKIRVRNPEPPLDPESSSRNYSSSFSSSEISVLLNKAEERLNSTCDLSLQNSESLGPTEHCFEKCEVPPTPHKKPLHPKVKYRKEIPQVKQNLRQKLLTRFKTHNKCRAITSFYH